MSFYNGYILQIRLNLMVKHNINIKGYTVIHKKNIHLFIFPFLHFSALSKITYFITQFKECKHFDYVGLVLIFRLVLFVYLF